MSSKIYLGMTAALLGGLFVGAVIYLDQKRRSSQEYIIRQSAIIQRRLAAKRFFLQELEAGHECLREGDVDVGVIHLSNAVAVSPHPSRVLDALEENIPDEAFGKLVQRIRFMEDRNIRSA